MIWVPSSPTKIFAMLMIFTVSKESDSFFT
jgi:hypothetical protein